METNEKELQTETAEDKTSENDGDSDVKTLSAQKKHWKEKAENTAKELAELKAKFEKAPEAQKVEKTNEPDYAKLAYLKSEKVEHPDDQKIVMEEAARLRLPLTDVLQMEHIKTRLQSNADTRNAQNGMPSGGKRTGAVTQQDVEYWVAKGEVPLHDQALAEKVVEAKMSRESQKNKFSEVPFIG